MEEIQVVYLSLSLCLSVCLYVCVFLFMCVLEMRDDALAQRITIREYKPKTIHQSTKFREATFYAKTCVLSRQLVK